MASSPCPSSPARLLTTSLLLSWPTGWCDYLVCDPIACPQETSAVEQWRKVRARRQHAADAAGSLPESSLDLDADIDPEDGSEEWI